MSERAAVLIVTGMFMVGSLCFFAGNLLLFVRALKL